MINSAEYDIQSCCVFFLFVFFVVFFGGCGPFGGGYTVNCRANQS